MQPNTQYTTLEPSSFDSPTQTITGDISTVVSSLGFLMVTISLFVVLGRVVLGGINYAEGSPTKINAGKKHFNVGGFGLLLTILFIPTLIYISPTFGVLSFRSIVNLPVINNDQKEDDTVGTPATTGTISTPNTSSGNKDFSAVQATEDAVREKLRLAGISVNKSACKDVNTTNCTSVGGLAENTITMLAKLKKSCEGNGSSCTIIVTGGTEWWLHSANTLHKPGGGAVDLSLLEPLNTYISKTFSGASPWKNKDGSPFCLTAYSWGGFYFCNEKGTHWHIQPN